MEYSAPARSFGDQVPGVVVEIGRPVVTLRERRHTDVEVAEVADQPDQFLGVLDALGMLVPLVVHIARRVAAQHQDVADPAVGVGADHRPQLVDAVAHRGQVRDRQQGGVSASSRMTRTVRSRVDPPAP